MYSEDKGFFYWTTKVLSYQLDINKEISTMAIAELLQEVAGTHANYSGFGYNDVIGKNMVWVLNALKFEVLHRPHWDDEIRIKTWVVDSRRFFSRRDFQIFDSKGNVIVKATSVWILYNFEKKRPQSIEPMNFPVKLQAGIYAVDKPIASSKEVLDVKAKLSFAVSYSDLDMVGHMNNTRYFQKIMDSYSLSFHQENKLKSIEIQFRNEAKYNEQLEIKTVDNELAFVHEIRRQSDDKSVCLARVEWY